MTISNRPEVIPSTSRYYEKEKLLVYRNSPLSKITPQLKKSLKERDLLQKQSKLIELHKKIFSKL